MTVNLINIDTIYAANSGRTLYVKHDMDLYEQHGTSGSTPYAAKLEKANLVSSEVEPDKHLPVIDMDFPIRAIPSSTEGHFHLYIDQELTWAQYRAFLDGMFAAGLIQKGWYESAMRDKRSYVRLPHISKTKPEDRNVASDDDLDAVTALLNV